MTGAEFVVDTITQMGTTDVFGIPGAVVLDFLYAAEANPDINIHLNYHEQMSSYAAIGYAQSSGKLGVAYSTRGPGVTNMMTAIAEAYFESVAVLFLTAHSNNDVSKQRFVADQEVDFTASIKPFSKMAVRINSVDELKEVFPKACKLAVTGRRGPVFIDLDTSLFREPLEGSLIIKEEPNQEVDSDLSVISEGLKLSKRPVILVGDGVRQTDSINEILGFARRNEIPILSSRGSQDIFAGSEFYYGYVGSHGIRYSNFIMSKADLLICLGNRLSFPLKSKSYKSIYENAKIIRIDVDEYELEKVIPNSISIRADIKDIKKYIEKIELNPYSEWLQVCDELKRQLNEEDVTENVSKVAEVLSLINTSSSIVSDVGNNEFLVSRAYEMVHPDAPLFFSRSFGTLGIGIGKAIGIYYATHKPVVCFIGDQGFQYNSQELQFISQWKLPISVVVLNNNASAMIRDKELQKYGSPLHTTIETGYATPNFEKLADAYRVEYVDAVRSDYMLLNGKPMLIEVKLNSDEKLVPSLPIGKPCQDMSPELDRDRYSRLNNL
ncbi:thiamine pyrophosphate-binding protein [Butyrivibrio sp. WCD2001]|uniref:thiamine pyrophosphate-binding protein n=1 Tax=Butyrivibrio sp. WCD2001 TaxID=1280681 RepID=UPI0004291776|nr:thiamine pyrophosphate-binding protein [Butyrivibrio sp. WCD2001]